MAVCRPRAEDGSASDRLSLRQRVEPAVPVSVWQGRLFGWRASNRCLWRCLPGLPGQGGVRVSVQSRLAGELPGVARWLEDYPFSCLEQRAAVALGRRDAAAWAKLQKTCPATWTSTAWRIIFRAAAPMGHPAAMCSPAICSASATKPASRCLMRCASACWPGCRPLLKAASSASCPVAPPGWTRAGWLTMLALQRHGRFRPAMLDVLSVQPQTWPTPMLVNWAELLLRQPAIPARDARLAQASQLLRARLLYQGARLALAREQQDNAWWLMEDGDLASARLLWLASQLPDWRDDAHVWRWVCWPVSGAATGAPPPPICGVCWLRGRFRRSSGVCRFAVRPRRRWAKPGHRHAGRGASQCAAVAVAGQQSGARCG